jgi:hypothetical protein
LPSIFVPGVVHQRQLNPRACWFTCLQMAVRYHESKARATLSDLTSPENFPDMLTRFNAGSNPSWHEWRLWAQRCGFTPLDQTPNALGVYQALTASGPIVYSGTWGNTFDGHVVILVGVNTETDALTLDDPLTATAPTVTTVAGYLGTLIQSLTDNPLFVY